MGSSNKLLNWTDIHTHTFISISTQLNFISKLIHLEKSEYTRGTIWHVYTTQYLLMTNQYQRDRFEHN